MLGVLGMTPLFLDDAADRFLPYIVCYVHNCISQPQTIRFQNIAILALSTPAKPRRSLNLKPHTNVQHASGPCFIQPILTKDSIDSAYE